MKALKIALLLLVTSTAAHAQSYSKIPYAQAKAEMKAMIGNGFVNPSDAGQYPCKVAMQEIVQGTTNPYMQITMQESYNGGTRASYASVMTSDPTARAPGVRMVSKGDLTRYPGGYPTFSYSTPGSYYNVLFTNYNGKWQVTVTNQSGQYSSCNQP